MFKLEAFIEDKNLAKVMHGLSGMVTNLQVVPVVNAAVSNGKLVAATNGTLNQLFQHWLTHTKLELVKPSDIRQFCVEHGRSPKSYSNVLEQMVAAGLLRKIAGTKGNRTGYRVVRK